MTFDSNNKLNSFKKQFVHYNFVCQSVFWKTITIVRTADDHYDDEEHINCAYLTFSNTSVKLFVKYEKRLVLVFPFYKITNKMKRW